MPSPGRAVSALALSVLLVLLACAPSAQAQRTDPLAGLDRDQRRVFKAYTRLFCAQFFRYGDDRFVVLPNYYTKRENSTGRTAGQAKQELTVTKREKVGAFYKEVSYPPSNAEIVAASRMLPDIDVGHYGYVNKVKILEITGPSEMIVGEIELIPLDQVGIENNANRVRLSQIQRTHEEKTYRLLGFRTRNLKVNQDYMGPKEKGLHVAVMSTDQEHDFVLVNYDELKRVRTSEFHEVLGYVKISPLAFLDMVRDNRERLLSEGDKTSLISIYKRFYNRYRPTRVTTAPPPPPKPQPTQPEPTPIDNGPDQVPGVGNDSATDPTPTPTPPPAAPTPEPQDVEDDFEDDWDPDEDSSSDDVDFFGIPLG